MKDLSLVAAEILLDLKCINFSLEKQFKLTSGKKSPIYCDCRRIISFPKQRKKLIDFGITKIKQITKFKNISNVAGGESAGIPFAAFLSSKLNLPMIYIRKEKKKFGKKSQIVGLLNKNDKVLLVEDLMTDGGSKINFLKALSDFGANIVAIFVIFNYGLIKDKYHFKNKKIDVISLTNWDSVLSVALTRKLLNDKEVNIVKKFLVEFETKN